MNYKPNKSMTHFILWPNKQTDGRSQVSGGGVDEQSHQLAADYISTNLIGLFVFAHWKWMQTMSQTPESRKCREYLRTSSETKGVVDKGSDWGSDTQEIEWKQGRVRDSENGSKRKPTTMTKKSFHQQSLVTYDNPENDSAYHRLSRSGCTAVFCDNIV